MHLEPFTGPGSTPARRRFWDHVVTSVLSCQKIPGKNVSIDVHHGYGSVINVNAQRQGSGGPPPFSCGGTIHVSLTADINGTCDTGIVISQITGQSFDDDLVVGSTTMIDTATLCVGTFESVTGNYSYVCGVTSTTFPSTLSYLIGIVTTAGSIYGTSFSVGDWVLVTGSYGIYPGGPLGACGPCNASGHAANLVLPSVLNTISLLEFGVTQDIDLTFTV